MYTVATQVQIHFRSAKSFSRAFFGTDPFADSSCFLRYFFTLLQQTQKNTFAYIFIC